MKYSLTIECETLEELDALRAQLDGDSSGSDDKPEAKPTRGRKKTTTKKASSKKAEKALTLEDVRAELSPLLKARGQDALREALLAGEGCDESKPKVSDLEPSSYADVIAKARELMAEDDEDEADPLG